jgi:hypothetical protein
MSGAALLEALELPEAALVGKRVPKTLLLEHGAATAADQCLINEGMEQLHWVAALKPTTVGVAAYRDGAREVVELAVLRLTLREGAKESRLIELVHRAVPYPVLLVGESGQGLSLSAAAKRWSRAEADQTVLEGEVVGVAWDGAADAERWPAFLAALALGRQPRAHLWDLYQGWLDTLRALQAARISGAFALAPTAEQAARRREALREWDALERESRRLRTAAAKEKQLARRVELNLALQKLEAARAAARAHL